jgi:ribonuclease P protein component
VLPAGSRLRHRADFASTLRRSRAARADGLLVVHLSVPDVTAPTDAPPRVGFAVSRAVGPAVTRNLVARRLRHLVRDRLDGLPRGSRLVVRALPPSATATYQQLDAALDRALRTALARERAAGVRP